MGEGRKLKRWAYYEHRDELRYYGDGIEAYAWVDIGDVELIIDEKGEIVDLAINNASKYFEREEIETIADVYRIEDLVKLSKTKHNTKQ